MTISNKLAVELFNKVQESQGYSFISDGLSMMDVTDEYVLDCAKASLVWTKRTATILEKFIKKYDKDDK